MVTLHGPVFEMRTDDNGNRSATYNGAPLNMRYDLRNHSPDGPNWGYGGSGPAQLALAIVAAALGDDDLALMLYQDYKWHLIAKVQSVNWTLPASSVVEWAQDQEKGREMMNRN